MLCVPSTLSYLDFREESIIFFDVSVLQALAQSTGLHTHQITESAVTLSFTTS